MWVSVFQERPSQNSPSLRLSSQRDGCSDSPGSSVWVSVFQERPSQNSPSLRLSPQWDGCSDSHSTWYRPGPFLGIFSHPALSIRAGRPSPPARLKLVKSGHELSSHPSVAVQGPVCEGRSATPQLSWLASRPYPAEGKKSIM